MNYEWCTVVQDPVAGFINVTTQRNNALLGQDFRINNLMTIIRLEHPSWSPIKKKKKAHHQDQGAITAISLSSYDDNILASAGEVTMHIKH